MTPCGCKIIPEREYAKLFFQRGVYPAYIEYCPLHKAAESLLKACRMAYAVLNAEPEDATAGIPTANKMLQDAIAAATAGKDTK